MCPWCLVAILTLERSAAGDMASPHYCCQHAYFHIGLELNHHPLLSSSFLKERNKDINLQVNNESPSHLDIVKITLKNGSQTSGMTRNVMQCGCHSRGGDAKKTFAPDATAPFGSVALMQREVTLHWLWVEGGDHQHHLVDLRGVCRPPGSRVITTIQLTLWGVCSTQTCCTLY